MSILLDIIVSFVVYVLLACVGGWAIEKWDAWVAYNRDYDLAWTVDAAFVAGMAFTAVCAGHTIVSWFI